MNCFSAVDESAHYGFSVCMLLEQYREQLDWARQGVAELGTGDATAIADVVAGLSDLRVRSFDISASSVERARENIATRGVADRYTVELGDFFDRADSAAAPPVSTVIANPPYIPAPDRDILMPELWGGVYGNDLVLQLLKAGYRNVITAVPSYADPGRPSGPPRTSATGSPTSSRWAWTTASTAASPRCATTSAGCAPRAAAGRGTASTWSPSPCSPRSRTSPATGRPSCSGHCSSLLDARTSWTPWGPAQAGDGT